MKNVLIILIFIASAGPLRAQVTNPGDAAKTGATDHANTDINNGVDNSLNKTESAIKGIFKKKKKTNPTTNSTDSSQASSNSNTDSKTTSIKAYQNYDFVAGDKIIFSDDFAGDQEGEFPAHWQISGNGQGVVNTQKGKKALVINDGEFYYLLPRITTKSYLGKEFTIEYDTYFEENAAPVRVIFHTAAQMTAYSDMDNDNYQATIYIDKRIVSYNTNTSGGNAITADLPSSAAEDNYINKWHHISIGYKNSQVKIYVDQNRVLTVPDCHVQPAFISFTGESNHEAPIIFSNVKLALGGSQNMIGNILTSGKFVTHGITFDIDKSTIKPESMGVLNEVATFLKSNASVSMEIDGHTDNSGNSAHNLQLSQLRADAVKAQLVNMGIDASRFTTKGLGDTKPMADNTTAEGKANNRRVEFVKI